MSSTTKRARSIIEGKVHRWAGAVSGQPGGFPLRDPGSAHQPEPVEHPGLVVVGDYLFDSTLNGVLRSAHIATDCIATQQMHSPARDADRLTPRPGRYNPHHITAGHPSPCIAIAMHA